MTRRFRFVFPVLAALAAVLLSACGGGGGGPQNAQDLLKQTFASGHDYKSGRISAGLTFDGQGLKTLTGPVQLNVSGPFQTSGKGKLPQLDLSLALQTAGSGTTIGIVSTGDKGYLRLQKQAFVLDDATFQKLKSTYEQSASKSNGASTGPSLKTLGIDPLRWLKNPTVASATESIGGTDTYHVTAAIDVAKFTTDLSTLLSKASALSSTTKLPSTLSAQQRQDIVNSVKTATLEVWTGKDDKALRRLRLAVDLDVPAAVRPRVGGLSTGHLGFDLTIADLNKSQDISAPADAQPLSSLQALLGGTTSGLGSSSGTGTATTPANPATPGPTGGAGSTKYLDCLAKAKSDVAKTQRCASLIGQ
jgi:hypothetical protein